MRLLLEFVGQVAGRPDLAVRMRVRAAHDLTAVLKDLHGPDVRQGAEIDRLLDPGVDDPLYVRDSHFRQRQVMAGREADDPADSGLALRHEEFVFDALGRGVGFQRGEVVVEDEGVGIVRVDRAVRPRIAGAEVAGRVVRQHRRGGDGFALALPRPLHAMRRHQHPFAGQRVQPAVRRLAEVELRHGSAFRFTARRARRRRPANRRRPPYRGRSRPGSRQSNSARAARPRPLRRD